MKKIQKGGQGSGIKGHMTQQGDKIVALNHKLEQKSAIENHLAKLKSGAPLEGATLRSGKPVYTDPEQARAHGYNQADFKEAAEVNYQKAQAVEQGIEKLKALGAVKNVKHIGDMTQILNFHRTQFKRNMKSAEQLTSRVEETKQILSDRAKPYHEARLKEAKASVRKSVVMMGHLDGAEVDTSKFAVENAKALESEWYDRFHSVMDGYKYGDEPRIIIMDTGNLYLVKVDDGMYSGVYKKIEYVPGETQAMEDNAKVRIERMSIPSLISFCMAKEWIRPIRPVEPPMQDVPVMAVEALNEKLMLPVPMVPEIVPTEHPLDRKIRILELIHKLVN